MSSINPSEPSESGQQPAPNISVPLAETSEDPAAAAVTAATAQAQGVNQTAASLQQSVNSVMFALANLELANQGPAGQLPGGLQPRQVTAPPVTKEWHQSVSLDLRNHLLRKLMQGIFGRLYPQAVLDKRMCAYARKTERAMYEIANSRSEYFHLLGRKIHKIQKMLEEKKQKKEEQQQQQLQQQRAQPMGLNQQVGLVPRPAGVPGNILPCPQQQPRFQVGLSSGGSLSVFPVQLQQQ